MGVVRELADHYVAERAALDPFLATFLGQAGHDHELTDHSPDGVAARVELVRRSLAAIEAAEPADDDDRRCAELARDRMGLIIEQFEADEHLRPLRSTSSVLHDLRESFDLMATDTDDQWATIVERVGAVPRALGQLRASLEAGIAAGLFSAPRQVLACARHLAMWAGTEPGSTSWFHGFVSSGPESLQVQLQAGSSRAAEAMSDLSRWLLTVYAPAAEGTPDAVGADRYRLGARDSLGSIIDTADAYEWGWAELERIEAEMVRTAAMILPGEPLAAVFEHLDRHGPAIEGEQNLLAYLQDLVDRTIDLLGAEHFAIPEPVRRCEVMAAPPGVTAQYYTEPTMDFSRPGRTFNPTAGRTRFPIWNQVSTCYHEAVPGHHLQLAQWVYRADQLSRYQSTTFISGNGEGWALYAERLMDELGYLDDPGPRLGFLVAQQLRTTRVIVDIGMHNSFLFPRHQPFHPGEPMTPELGREFLLAHAGSDVPFLESEWVRYLGWPGQAIAYKLGERVWLEGRDAARRRVQRDGKAFDLRTWHGQALDSGSLGLDALAALLPTLG